MNRRERRAQGKSAQIIQDAVARHRAGRLGDAEALYRRVLKDEARNSDALHLLGVVLFQQGRHAEAADFIRRAIAARPGMADFHNHLAVALGGAGRPREALAELDIALRLDPGKAEIHLNIGNAAREIGEVGRAEASYRRAIELAPALASAHMNLGNVLGDRGAVQDAIAEFRKAITIEPGYAEAHMNLGVALKDIGATEEAIEAYRRALALYSPALKDKIASTHYNLALALLIQGDFEQGWREYEWRHDPLAEATLARPHRQPRWQGGLLDAKKLLIWGEQGIGDELIHGSMLTDAIAAGLDIVFECSPRLVPLFARAFPGLEIVPRTDPPAPRLEAADIGAQIALPSLGGLYRKSWQAFPRRHGHIMADPARIATFTDRYRQAAAGRPIVGISWKSGNARIGRWKSSPLEAWAPIFALKDVLFVDLQYGDTAADRALVEERFGIALHRGDDVDALQDLDGFAAQVAAVDRVLSVSNTTVHFAGALGKPVTTLLHQGALWYWFRGRADTPWYPTMRLLRQGPDADWQAVFAQAATELAKDIGRT